jgi:hypothetical protein
MATLGVMDAAEHDRPSPWSGRRMLGSSRWHMRMLERRFGKILNDQEAVDAVDFAQPSHNPYKSVSGMVRPSALAVLRLMTRSIFVICCTGRSACPNR